VLATTPRVVAEGYGWFLRRYDGRRVLDSLALIEILRRFADQALTLADATGLHPMAERGVTSCGSTDRQLGLTSVPLVIREH
jgi:hypothetical protein